MSSPEQQKQVQLANIASATGRTVADWAAVVAAAGSTKHSEIVAYLKTEHGLTHGNANALAHAVREVSAGGPTAPADLLAAQYAGTKERLRPIHDEIVLVARGLGTDVDVVVNKTGVSLRRRRQFAVVEAPSSKRVRLGLNLKGHEPGGRLRAVQGMCTHAVDVTDIDDVDDELTDWLRAAYDAAS
jgi:hypothetical protein